MGKPRACLWSPSSMKRAQARNAKGVASKLIALSFAVPPVMAHRTARMALAGSKPSARDRKEFNGMVAEKQIAFTQSGMAMATQAMRAQQAWMASLATAMWAPWTMRSMSPLATMRRLQETSLAIANQGLAPLQRKAVANSKRLSRTRLR
jgi:hypothetical protein